MERVNTQRILELADAVEAYGNRFDFCYWTRGWNNKPNECGTTACALGIAVEKWGAECGVIFKTTFATGETLFPSPALLSSDSTDVIDAARAMFGELSEDAFITLFVPERCIISEDRLPVTASAKEWAAHARRWVAEYERQHA
jgi:hypothetical protein